MSNSAKFTTVSTKDTFTSENAVIEQVLGPERDTLCWKGKWDGKMQSLATPVTYLVVSSVIALVQGTFFTYSNATLSSVEKRFGLTSKLSGLTTTGNDVTQLLLSIPFAFIAGRGHRPRWLAFGMILAALGCLSAVLPHFFIVPNTEASSNMQKDHLCLGSNKSNVTADCDAKDTQPSSYAAVVVMLLFGQMLAGVASLLYYTIGYSYLDDSVSKEKSPLYLSIAGGVRLIGPVCGYSLASWALSLWIHPYESQSRSLTRSHPHWVGAWWVGYIIIGSVLFAISWVLLLLPKTLPATRRRKQNELMKVAQNGISALHEHIRTLRSSQPLQWNELVPSLWRLATNGIYRIILLNQVLFWFSFFGFITFKSKFLEHQFRLSAAEANRYIAGISLCSALIGWVGTGATLSYFRPKPKSVIMYMAFLSMVSCVCHLIQMNLSCDHGPVIGLESALQNSSRIPSFCDESCLCSKSFSPVCHVDDSKVYYNACLAGCHTSTSNSTKKFYADCSCVQNGTSSSMVVDGYCAPKCPSFTSYIGVAILAKMSHAASRVPLNILLFRCVNDGDKDLGLGVFNAILALCASIPAPTFFGWIIAAFLQIQRAFFGTPLVLLIATVGSTMSASFESTSMAFQLIYTKVGLIYYMSTSTTAQLVYSFLVSRLTSSLTIKVLLLLGACVTFIKAPHQRRY